MSALARTTLRSTMRNGNSGGHAQRMVLAETAQRQGHENGLEGPTNRVLMDRRRRAGQPAPAGARHRSRPRRGPRSRNERSNASALRASDTRTPRRLCPIRRTHVESSHGRDRPAARGRANSAPSMSLPSSPDHLRAHSLDDALSATSPAHQCLPKPSANISSASTASSLDRRVLLVMIMYTPLSRTSSS